jgi:AAA domain
MKVVPLREFTEVDEAGAEAIVGDDADTAVVAEGGDVVVYGDGGAGKTTLVVDLVFHLGAGDEWLGMPVTRAVNVLVIENEGPRPHFRRKLARKKAAWRGGPLSRIYVLEEPWCGVTLRDQAAREHLAEQIRQLDIDVVVIGPVTASGMLEAGTITEVREFMALVNDVRLRAGTNPAFILVHHENKGGQVSGAWEGVCDTLVHVQGQGHGRTRLFFQKARWSSSHHGTSLHLAWADGESFEVVEAERDDDVIADEILDYVRRNGGTSWARVEDVVEGRAVKLRSIRDRLLVGERISNLGKANRTQLWHADDPSRPDRDGLGTATPSASGEGGGEQAVPPSRLNRDGLGTDGSLFSPDEIAEEAA